MAKDDEPRSILLKKKFAPAKARPAFRLEDVAAGKADLESGRLERFSLRRALQMQLPLGIIDTRSTKPSAPIRDATRYAVSEWTAPDFAKIAKWAAKRPLQLTIVVVEGAGVSDTKLALAVVKAGGNETLVRFVGAGEWEELDACLRPEVYPNVKRPGTPWIAEWEQRFLRPWTHSVYFANGDPPQSEEEMMRTLLAAAVPPKPKIYEGVEGRVFAAVVVARDEESDNEGTSYFARLAWLEAGQLRWRTWQEGYEGSQWDCWTARRSVGEVLWVHEHADGGWTFHPHDCGLSWCAPER